MVLMQNYIMNNIEKIIENDIRLLTQMVDHQASINEQLEELNQALKTLNQEL